MGNRKLKVATIAVLTVLAAGGAGSVSWADDAPVTRAADPAAAAPAAATLDRSPELYSEEVQACLSGYPNDCGDYPIPLGGTCSCTAQLTIQSCTTCESGQHGSVLSTTCTVCAPCQFPPCTPLPACQQYESSSCRAGRS